MADYQSLDERVAVVESELRLLKWIVGVAAAVLAGLLTTIGAQQFYITGRQETILNTLPVITRQLDEIKGDIRDIWRREREDHLLNQSLKKSYPQSYPNNKGD